MNIQQQKQLINLYKQYQDTDKDIIKANLKAYMDESKLNLATIAEQTKIPIVTIYQMRKHNNTYKPDFITSIIICDTLQILITNIMQPVTDLFIPSPKTKWNTTTRRKFIQDYKSMDVTALTKKWNIGARTAQEYNRIFRNELTK